VPIRLRRVSSLAKSFDYAVTLDETWDARSDRGGGVLAGADEASWTPEHLVLAGLARCTLTSLRYHCVRADVALTASAAVRGTVNRRDSDARFAFVEIAVEADVSFVPKPNDAEVSDLLAKAERDCFVGASLDLEPSYLWRVA
jgi:organic hydroperoxide reductase OsmC/OhrA